MARTFDGSTDVFYKANTTLGNNFGAITVGGWVKRNGAQPDTGFGMMFGQLDTGGSVHAWLVFIKTAGVRFRLYGQGGYSRLWDISDDVTSGEWVHVCCSWLSSTTPPKIYLNGSSKTLDNSTFLNVNLYNAEPDTLFMGAGNTTPDSFRFKGDLADLFIYNNQLSDANVALLAGGSRPGSVGTGLVGWWKLEEASAGDNAVDEQATNNLTAVSSPATASGPTYGGAPVAVITEVMPFWAE